MVISFSQYKDDLALKDLLQEFNQTLYKANNGGNGSFSLRQLRSLYNILGHEMPDHWKPESDGVRIGLGKSEVENFRNQIYDHLKRA